MDDLNFMDSLASSAEVAESPSGVTRHPCGSFAGTISNVTQKTVNDRPVWEIFVTTAHGTCSNSSWGFSPQDMAEAKTRQDARERMLGAIGRYKRLMVDCGLWDKSQARSASWNDILGAWAQLIGKRCEAVVKPNFKKPGYTTTFLNALSENHKDRLDQEQPAPAPAQRQQPGGEYQGGGVSNRKPPGSDSDLNDIPF